MKKQLLKTLFLLALCPLGAQAQTPPATWQEHWFEHNQLLTKVYEDNDLALYYDNDVNTTVTWPRQYLSSVWRYTKQVYGSFGTDPHMYAILHTNKYSGGHPSTYFDAGHDLRNVIDAGPGPWTGATQGDYNLLTHEVGHIVELASKNMHGSPAFGIWGDSKWCEIYLYDVYKGLGLESRATNAYNEFMGKTDNFPRANTAWFKNWFYPIYSQYGGSAVLNRYFVQLALYFRKNGNDYPGMNMGEFVHFWSGAAGVNLKAQATIAFGWTSEYEAQFVKAQQDFPFSYATPGVTAASLFQDINYGGYGVHLPAGSYTLTQLRAYGARNDDITAIRVTPGFSVTLYQDDNFSGSSLTLTADNPLLNGSWNDKVSSVVISALAPVATTVAKEETAGLVAYPNPVINGSTLVVKIDGYKAHVPAWISLVDVNKRVVLQQRAGAAVENLSTAHLAPGVYVLVLSNGGKQSTQKIVIQ
ncbi:T9SS type A sorting domain-containing protein [uncultured Chitinophaga sp.]|jgi:hypothetical protein|uniref:T9SS type A sorting domain-containing protein n=1 Tax=uncultured Chitinophaga sp. TaxID=339340 RepID=UPI002634267F|nr:T9SS type A sorting domain-containing protein [uncultured Chitinophaga sp.]